MSIVTAVGEGRNIYRNMLRCVHFLLSCNIAEILVVIYAMSLGLFPSPIADNAYYTQCSLCFASMAGYPDILKPLHVLWINAVTDGLPALAMGYPPLPYILLFYASSSARLFSALAMQVDSI